MSMSCKLFCELVFRCDSGVKLLILLLLILREIIVLSREKRKKIDQFFVFNYSLHPKQTHIHIHRVTLSFFSPPSFLCVFFNLITYFCSSLANWKKSSHQTFSADDLDFDNFSIFLFLLLFFILTLCINLQTIIPKERWHRNNLETNLEI